MGKLRDVLDELEWEEWGFPVGLAFLAAGFDGSLLGTVFASLDQWLFFLCATPIFVVGYVLIKIVWDMPVFFSFRVIDLFKNIGAALFLGGGLLFVLLICGWLLSMLDIEAVNTFLDSIVDWLPLGCIATGIVLVLGYQLRRIIKLGESVYAEVFYDADPKTFAGFDHVRYVAVLRVVFHKRHDCSELSVKGGGETVSEFVQLKDLHVCHCPYTFCRYCMSPDEFLGVLGWLRFHDMI